MKLALFLFKLCVIISFNWTKVELKLSEIEKIIETQQSFNWTKVELKPSAQETAWRIGENF